MNAWQGGLDAARKVADAVMFEGYLLYPYRASAQKNRLRWQFGVLAPPGWTQDNPSEPSACQTECLLEPRKDARLRVVTRFLQVQARTVEAGGEPVERLEVDGNEYVPWDEGVEQSSQAAVAVSDLLAGEQVFDVAAPAGVDVEPLRSSTGEQVGRLIRSRQALSGVLRLAAFALEGPYGGVRLRVRLENHTDALDSGAPRDQALRRSLVAAHTLLAVSDGAFISLLEPPEWAKPAVAGCDNQHTFPVLVGERPRRDVMLSAPIILYDYPEIAPESPRDLFDATEIDEILTLRTMALTEDEKREARATDPRAAGIMDHVDDLPAEMLEKLHGAVRYLRESPRGAAAMTLPSATEPEQQPWWDPGADASVSPETDHVVIAGVAVAKGARVRLRPGSRRADAQDMFLEGREAVVEAVLFDVDDNRYLAVTLEGDPGAELQRWHGRFLYFSPDEVQPLVDGGAATEVET